MKIIGMIPERVLSIDYDCKMLPVDTPKELDHVREILDEKMRGGGTH